MQEYLSAVFHTRTTYAVIMVFIVSLLVEKSGIKLRINKFYGFKIIERPNAVKLAWKIYWKKDQSEKICAEIMKLYC